MSLFFTQYPNEISHFDVVYFEGQKDHNYVVEVLSDIDGLIWIVVTHRPLEENSLQQPPYYENLWMRLK